MKMKIRQVLKNLTILYFIMIPVSGSIAQVSHLISFELEDQFERIYTEDSFKGKMVVVIGSDKGGSEYNSKWGEAIVDKLGRKNKNRVNWVAVADLRVVPFFMKGYVRNQFPENEEEWVLLDWDGLFAKAYEFKNGNSNVLVFSTTGNMLYQTFGKEVLNEELVKITGVIQENYNKE